MIRLVAEDEGLEHYGEVPVPLVEVLSPSTFLIPRSLLPSKASRGGAARACGDARTSRAKREEGGLRDLVLITPTPATPDQSRDLATKQRPRPIEAWDAAMAAPADRGEGQVGFRLSEPGATTATAGKAGVPDEAVVARQIDRAEMSMMVSGDSSYAPMDSVERRQLDRSVMGAPQLPSIVAGGRMAGMVGSSPSAYETYPCASPMSPGTPPHPA
jgi:hypothetical protein